MCSHRSSTEYILGYLCENSFWEKGTERKVSWYAPPKKKHIARNEFSAAMFSAGIWVAINFADLDLRIYHKKIRYQWIVKLSKIKELYVIKESSTHLLLQ